MRIVTSGPSAGPVERTETIVAERITEATIVTATIDRQAKATIATEASSAEEAVTIVADRSVVIGAVAASTESLGIAMTMDYR